MRKFKCILLYLLHFLCSPVYTTYVNVPLCKALSKKSYWKKAFDLEYFKNPDLIWWDGWGRKSEPNIWQRLTLSTQCFTWEAFSEGEEDENIIILPFYEIIDAAELILNDFIDFCKAYVRGVLHIIQKLCLFDTFVNPATIFALGIFLFYKKLFLPLFKNIEKTIENENDISEYCSSCDVINSNPTYDSSDIEKIAYEN